MIDWIQDLPANVRLGLFGVIVVAVLGLGWQVMSTEDAPADETSTSTGDTPPVVTVPEDDGGVVENPTEGVDLRLELPVDEVDLKVAAGRAIKFSELYLSYRYDEDVDDKASKIERLLADANAIDLSSVFPTGNIATEMTKDETVMSSEVLAIEADLISSTMLSLSVSVETTTSTKSAADVTESTEYAVTMALDAGRSDWYVSEFFLTGDDAFHDEEVN